MTFIVLVNRYTYCSNSLRDDIPFERLNRITGHTVPVPFAKGVFDTLDPSIPHLGTIIIGGGDSDGRLQWSEVCWAASLMAGRLRERQYQAYGIVPVSIYRHTNCLLVLANVALQGIYILHHQNECTCDSNKIPRLLTTPSLWNSASALA